MLVGSLFHAIVLRSTKCRETVADIQLMHENRQSWPIGIGAAPEPHPVVLAKAFGIQRILNAKIRLHVAPCLSGDFVTLIPH